MDVTDVLVGVVAFVVVVTAGMAWIVGLEWVFGRIMILWRERHKTEIGENL